MSSKITSAYWKPKLKKRSFKDSDGNQKETSEWYVRISYAGKRKWVALALASQDSASRKAATFYHNLMKGGWELAEEEHVGGRAKVVKTANVGSLIKGIAATDTTRKETLTVYFRKFRTLVSEIEGISKSKDRYNYQGDGRKKWLESVDSVELSKLTPQKVQAWKRKRIDAAGDDAKKRAASIVTINSILRNSMSLFSKERLQFVDIDLPKTLPFEGIKLEKAPKKKYRSRIGSLEFIGQKAFDELHKSNEEVNKEAYKVFVIAVGAGLRRSEIDRLEWNHVDFANNTISVETTEHGQVKSAESESLVDISPGLSAFLQRQKAASKQKFVIKGTSAGGITPGGNRKYRCDKVFRTFTKWFKANIHDCNNPIHELRKEFGSLIASEAGIYAASTQLRHANIQLTRDVYLDKKKVTVVDVPILIETDTAEDAAATSN